MQTILYMEPAHYSALKRLAATLGLTQKRGPGAGTVPNVSALVRQLADLADEAEFVEVVKKLSNQREKTI